MADYPTRTVRTPAVRASFARIGLLLAVIGSSWSPGGIADRFGVAAWATLAIILLDRAKIAPMRCGVLLFLVAVGLAADRPFVIRVLDSQTGRGVPLVELRAFNQRAWYSDSNGIVAISDAWAMGRDLLLQVRSHGYRFERQALDQPGTIVAVKPGGRAEFRIVRENIARSEERRVGKG